MRSVASKRGLMVIYGLAAAGCGRLHFDVERDASVGNVDATTGQTFAYIADGIAPTIAIARYDPATGALTDTAASPYALGFVASVMTASNAVLYVTGFNANTVRALRIDALTGALTEIDSETVMKPWAVAVHPSQPWLYVGGGGGGFVYGFTIAGDGTLTAMPGPFTHAGSDSNWLAPYGNNRMYVAACGTRALYAMDVAADGTLTATGAMLPVMDSCPNQALIVPENNHGFISPIDSGGIPAFTIDPSTGAMSTTAGSRFASQANTTFWSTFTPNADVLITANSGIPSVDALRIDKTTGALSPVPGTPLPMPDAEGIAVGPNGLVYVTTGSPSAVLTLHADATGISANADTWPLQSLGTAPNQILFVTPRG